MIQIKKTILTLVALLAVTTGAWATDVITVKWSSGETYENNNSKDGVTLSGDIVYYYADEWQLAYDEEKGTFTTELGNFTKIEITGGYINGFSGEGWSGGRTWTGNAAAVPFGGYLTDDSGDRPWTITFTIEPASDAPASSGPEVAWDKAKNTGTFTMPGGNVTLEPEYYPQATLAFQGLTAAEDAAAKTEAPLAVVADGAVTGGTLMYYVTTDKNFSQADAIALAETQWSAAIPTAETVEAAGTCYVWYYIKGDDEHSDTDPKPLQVTVLPEPTYTVEFAEGTPETDKWKADPAAGVTKGQTVTVTYTGSKKVLGVKAEKKAKAAVPITVTWNNDDITGSGNSFTKDGVTITAGDIDFDEKNFIGGGTFTTTLGNFTKIEVTTSRWQASGEGWSGSTWTGNASSVSFSDDIKDRGEGTTKFVFTIEPTN
ncbi:hypothetical protein [Xylanibacter ruminicola]|uniref:hypothetical protein n=1 Tax=Xylanibacter ruminicola TaxID=839 RepID=UPI0012D2D48D|nr:hypothetical protein [Xylanibacter ruminicola]